MLDAHAPIAAQPTLQRSRGAASVRLGPGVGRAALRGLVQSGSARAFLPRVHGGPVEVYFLNTSGGLTGGDRLSLALDLAPGARAVGTTQTAERAYRSTGGAAHVSVRAEVGAGAHLDWLPQETILFEGAHLVRETEIALAPDASCLMLEAVVIGRAAMGERPMRPVLHDTRRVLRAGRPVWADGFALDAGVMAQAGAPAMLGGARAVAVVALIAQGAEDAAAGVRAIAAEAGCAVGVSGFDGRCIVRLMAADGWPLRRQIARILGHLRPTPLPRCWQI